MFYSTCFRKNTGKVAEFLVKAKKSQVIAEILLMPDYIAVKSMHRICM